MTHTLYVRMYYVQCTSRGCVQVHAVQCKHTLGIHIVQILFSTVQQGLYIKSIYLMFIETQVNLELELRKSNKTKNHILFTRKVASKGN